MAFALAAFPCCIVLQKFMCSFKAHHLLSAIWRADYAARKAKVVAHQGAADAG
jgi:hypothetical protein